jgi:hypothetical protein
VSGCVVWCGVVLCGVVLCGVVWCYVLCGTWCDVLEFGVRWGGVLRVCAMSAVCAWH